MSCKGFAVSESDGTVLTLPEALDVPLEQGQGCA